MEMLNDLADHALQAAVRHCISTCKFLPSIAEIREASVSLTEQISATDDAGTAWSNVTGAFRKGFSLNRAPKFDTLTQSALDAIGGWQHVCMSDDTRIMADRSQFIRAYNTLLQRQRTVAQMTPQVREYVTLAAAQRREQLAARKTLTLEDGSREISDFARNERWNKLKAQVSV